MAERDIFHAAIEIAEPAERSSYLEKACAGDPGLKRLVEDILQVYPQLGTFLESPAVGFENAADKAPVRAGRFQLGPELARGGMGVVYCARDESLGRDVAVKQECPRLFASRSPSAPLCLQIQLGQIGGHRCFRRRLP